MAYLTLDGVVYLCHSQDKVSLKDASMNGFYSLTSCQNHDDSYATIFHSVMSDTRVAVPSHIKRFSIKMFTFTKDEEVLKDEVKKNLLALCTWECCV